MNKNALLSLGVIGYNTDSDFWSLFSDVAYGEPRSGEDQPAG